jgi:hypothetical protein
MVEWAHNLTDHKRMVSTLSRQKDGRDHFFVVCHRVWLAPDRSQNHTDHNNLIEFLGPAKLLDTTNHPTLSGHITFRHFSLH